MAFPYLSDLVYWLTGWRLPLPFAMFGLFVAFGALAAAACLRRELSRLYRSGGIGPARRMVKGQNGTAVPAEAAPHTLVSDFAIVVLVAGVIGSRVFHILEHLDEFRLEPWSMIFSRSGLSIYGGLIFGAGAGVLLLRRWRIPVRPFMDAIAPALMLGYAIGRLGCQVSGDGDWGIAANMAAKPAWLPGWLWAQNYDHNIAGVLIAAPGVYPAPIYESLMALACFALLWALRRHRFQAGWLFSLYLVLAGAERFLIEQIRVNVQFHFHGLTFTQAELISVVYLCLGAVGLALLSRPAPAVRLGAH
ncbi:prolipoprotein diacylglyceryl transferase [Massilia sp. 9096]|uniref:prolipoprotein diacylglyceryl transferase n=1 Tax=Massilia sp. 9096 TaxID=1500894 RepID=UPI000560E4AF|nr:prolipoprotein diacylglyceryl transferase family protein [Massilia sp. 9096]